MITTDINQVIEEIIAAAAYRAEMQAKLVPTHAHPETSFLADSAGPLAAEVKRLRAGGCARDQRTTQFCAEVVQRDAEIARLRAEVATLHEGWQAERDAALRAHDLLIAERQAAPPIFAAEQALEGQSRAEVELKRRADKASASLAAKIGEIRDLRAALDELTRVRAAENGEQGGAPDGGWYVASWSPGRRPTWCRQAVVQGHAGTLYVEYDPLRSGKGWQWSFSGPTASSAYQDAKDPRDGMIAANGAVA